EETRNRVLEVAARLDYRPNRVARSLRAQSSKIIGLIISDIQNPFFTAVVRAVEDIAQAHEYFVLLCNTDENREKEALYIELMIAERVAGVIVSPAVSSSSYYQMLLDAGIAVVAIDRRLHNLTIDTVHVENRHATAQVVSHLINQGHTRIGAVIGTSDISTGHERQQGYLDALRARLLPADPSLIRTGIPQIPIGYRLTQELLALPEPPTAIFTGNNLLTIGALRAIHEAGLAVPDDIAVAAFDEMDWMFVINPPLTVVAQPAYAMGEQAAKLLLQRIEEPERAVVEIELAPTVHIRQSSARPVGR
ncbi:MAG: substrate-binding domain-containing protein, partial [Caldilineaceae bacterium]|nr:substrate-binding domain-containing protein [Caldilineaceae bacterium]